MKTHFKRLALTVFSTALICCLAPAGAYADAQTGTTDTGGQSNSAPAADNAAQPGQTEDTSGQPAQDGTAKKKKAVITYKFKGVDYRVKNRSGWTETVSNGKKAGSTGAGISSLRIYKPEFYKLKDGKKAGTVRYSLNVEVNIAGQGWKKVPWNSSKRYRTISSSGTIQAIRITPGTSLTENKYKIYYRVATESFGWMNWAKNGQAAGTTGNGKSICALRVKLVAKGKKAPTANTGLSMRYFSAPGIDYAADTAAAGTERYVSDGSTAGSSVWNSKTQRFKAKISNAPFDGGVSYSVRTGASAWSAWKSGGKLAGKNGKTAQALRIKLTGTLSKYYDVYYRAYCGDNHWLGWAKNGQTAGTGKIGYPLGAVQVELVNKGDGAPGSTAGHYKTKKASYGAVGKTLFRKAQPFSSGSGHLIFVDRSSCRVIIFEGSKDNWHFKYSWTCDVGAPATPTPAGTYHTSGAKLNSFGEKKGYSCYCATQIRGDYLFHSILYYPHTNSVMDGRLGYHISHGCVRLSLEHARWIYNNIYGGTTVYIY